MSSLAGAVETAPVSALHASGSLNPDDFPVPGGREEEWRFTPLNRLRGLHKDAPLTGTVKVAVEAAPELTVDEITLAERERATASAPFLPMDRVSARAYDAAGTATVVTVPKETVASAPTYVRVTGTGTDVAAAGHLVIDVQPYGKATVVIDQTGSATYADNVEIHVADGGNLTVVVLADWAADTVQVSQHVATLGKDAQFTHFAVTLGGSLVRLAPIVRYAAPGGDAQLHGITFADAGQHLEARLFVDHDTPNCRSRVGYKGALSGAGARTVWIGDVLIRPEATGTDTYEFNRNLILSDDAHGQRPAGRGEPVLPAVPGHPVRGGAPAGHPRLLRRADRPHRHPGARGANRGQDRN
jgi:Fe-S cluster assembly protein SufD